MRQVATGLDRTGLGLLLATWELVRNVKSPAHPRPAKLGSRFEQDSPSGASHAPEVWEGPAVRMMQETKREDTPLSRGSSVKQQQWDRVVSTPSLSGDHNLQTKPDTELLIKSVLSPDAGGKRGKMWTGKCGIFQTFQKFVCTRGQNISLLC